MINFNTDGPVTISVTASNPHYWNQGVEIQPMRLGLWPVRHGATITFHMSGPSKLTITRPGDYFADADILFLFANAPDYSGITAATPGIRYYGPGIYHESINAHSEIRFIWPVVQLYLVRSTSGVCTMFMSKAPV